MRGFFVAASQARFLKRRAAMQPPHFMRRLDQLFSDN
jgi:hypothetical protein